MATVLGVLSVHVQDAYGIVGTAPVFVECDDTKTLAQVITDALAYQGQVQGISQGTVVRTTLQLDAYNNPMPSLGAGDIEKGALFNFNNASDPYATGLLVPDVNPSILNGSGLIDLSNGSVTSYIAWITTAHTAITVITKGVRALTALRDALIAFRKHRKPLSRKTTEKP